MKKILVVISILLNVAFVGYVSRRAYFKFVQLPDYEADATNREEKSKSNLTPLTPDFYLKWRARLFESMPISGSPIIFVGDSHTDNFMLDEYFPSWHILNRGISADTTGGVLARIREITKRHPTKVFIQIGINDINRVVFERSILNYRAILDSIKMNSPKTKIYIQSLLPTSLDSLRRIRTISFNKFIKKEAKDRNITFIDLYYKFSQGDSLCPKYDSGDKIHLSQKGYELWYKIIKPYLLVK